MQKKNECYLIPSNCLNNKNEVAERSNEIIRGAYRTKVESTGLLLVAH